MIALRCGTRERHPASLCGGTMIRISLAYIYNFATWIEPLANVKAGEKVSDRWFDLLVAQNAVEGLLNSSVFAREIRTSRTAANALITNIKSLTDISDPNKDIAGYQASGLQYALSNFKTIALAELETLNAHFVTQKRGYDTMALIDYAEIIFPPDFPIKVPEAVTDIKQAGKCIAFELPTAAGFHLHRANEAVLHRYYDEVSGGRPRPKNRNIGGYLSEMQRHSLGDARLLSTLRDLNDLHRNPLVHPEQSLDTIDDAIALLDAIHNAAVFMLKVIPMPTPPTPATSALQGP